ncbi:MAG TPA: ABC transporter substrate-binding protein [Methylomirabilota bacterium]|jgi:phospholipid transport system substrate-binding protein|nr:ABC transporter substrate-binding protein [Methylomirabilota bacterium]
MAAARVLATAVMMATVLTSGVAAWAGAPTEQLRGRIDRVLQVLEDPQLKSEARTPERRQAVRTIVEEIFDFRELSQRSLGPHWKARTPAERDEFVQLFADLLERSYITKIELYSGGERIQYTAEALDGDDLATVRTKIITKQGTEVPVDYRMHRVDARWLVYDVAIEGVSLVANYRAQFNKIIQRSSFKGLLAQLVAKRDEAASDGPVKRASQR